MPRRFLRLKRSLRSDERGSAALLIAPVMLALMGAAALGVDTMNAFTAQEDLRTAAQAAATAALFELPDEDEALDKAVELGNINLPPMGSGTIITDDEVEFGHWDKVARTFEPDPDTETVNAVRVTASLKESKGNPLQTMFAKVIGISAVDVSASATATHAGGLPCVLALDTSASQSFLMKSNSQLEVQNCEVHVNSTSSSAYVTDSNAIVDSDANCVRGSFQELSNSDVTPDHETGCDPLDDPFADIAQPTVGACTFTGGKTYDNKIQAINPGVYCGGLTIKNNSIITLNPGVYIIKDGKFLLDGNSRITGNEVGFYLTGSASLLEFNSNTQVSLTSPQSGPLKGFLFFQRRTDGGQHRFDSNTAALLDGAMYFKNGDFKSDSNTQMAASSSCLMLVARRIYFDSNAGMNMTADYTKCPWMLNVLAGKHSKIVG